MALLALVLVHGVLTAKYCSTSQFPWGEETLSLNEVPSLQFRTRYVQGEAQGKG